MCKLDGIQNSNSVLIIGNRFSTSEVVMVCTYTHACMHYLKESTKGSLEKKMLRFLYTVV